MLGGPGGCTRPVQGFQFQSGATFVAQSRKSRDAQGEALLGSQRVLEGGACLRKRHTARQAGGCEQRIQQRGKGEGSSARGS